MNPSNRVSELRVHEGLTVAALARLCDLSDHTLRKVERGGKCAPSTKYKVVNGFNRHPRRKRDYTFEDLYPGELPT